MAKFDPEKSGVEWAATYLELHEGEFPNLQAIADALLSGAPMPEKVARFLADYMTGKIKRPRGRTKYRDSNLIDRRISESLLRSFFSEEYDKANATRNFVGTPFEVALERTAKVVKAKVGLSLSPEAIKKRLKLRDRSK